MKWRVSVPRNKPALFLLSASVRAHTQEAWQRCQPVVAIDGFGDADLQADRVFRTGLEDGQFTSEVVEIVAQESGLGDRLVYGSGFEAVPELLDALQAHVEVLGNSADVIRLASDPVRLAEHLDRLGIPAPETRDKPPEDPTGWLLKRKGRSGGCHVRPTAENVADPVRDCWQRFCPGEAHSALFLSSGTAARVAGVSRLLAGEVESSPYAWSGAVGPVEVLPEVLEQVQWIAETLTRETGLRGLCGFDFILNARERVQVIDLNPRLTATCELYRERFMTDYLSAHVEACESGRLDALPDDADLPSGPVRGVKVIYAPWTIAGKEGIVWPDGAADLPGEGVSVPAGQPLCTVRGTWSGFAAACAGLRGLSQQVLAPLGPR